MALVSVGVVNVRSSHLSPHKSVPPLDSIAKTRHNSPKIVPGSIATTCLSVERARGIITLYNPRSIFTRNRLPYLPRIYLSWRSVSRSTPQDNFMPRSNVPVSALIHALAHILTFTFTFNLTLVLRARGTFTLHPHAHPRPDQHAPPQTSPPELGFTGSYYSGG